MRKTETIWHFSLDFLVASVAMLIQLVIQAIPTIYGTYYSNPLTYLVGFCKSRNYLIQVTSMIYRWALIGASFDRYAMSSANARLRRFSSVHMARRILAVIVVIWFALPLYILVIYDIQTRSCGVFNNYAMSLYVVIFTFVNTFVIPVPLMTIFTLLIRKNLANKRQRRQFRLNQYPITTIYKRLQEKRDRQAFIMLFAQILVYVTITTPWMAYSIYNIIASTIPNKDAVRIAIDGFVAALAGSLVFIFPTASFYIYTLTSNMFRGELLTMLRSVFYCPYLKRDDRIHPTTNAQE